MAWALCCITAFSVFYTLGAVFLAVTGAEALYADLGHFGRLPIQTAWLCLVLPALTLNYLGQGALVFAHPEAIANPFFLLYPEWARIPMVVLATAATVIASQAVITGAYSLTSQAIQLGLLPRFEIRHTSAQQAGQIYMPRINALLLVGVLLLVGLFRSSSALASAYGIAVSGTMVVTGIMAFVVMWRMWRWSPIAGGSADDPVPADRSDVSFGQHAQGGRGRLGTVVARRHRHADHVHVATRLAAAVREDAPPRNAARRSRPHAGAEAATAGPWNGGLSDERSEKRAHGFAAQSQALSGAAREERHPVRRDPLTRRASIRQSASASSRSARPSCACICASATWKRRTFPRRWAWPASWGCSSTSCRPRFFCPAARLRPAPRSGMPRWQDRLFITLARSANDATDYFQIPTDRVVEVGTQVTI